MKTLKNISYVVHTLAHVTLHEKGPSAMSTCNTQICKLYMQNGRTDQHKKSISHLLITSGTFSYDVSHICFDETRLGGLRAFLFT